MLRPSRQTFPFRLSHRSETPRFSLVNPKITTLFVVVPSPPTNLRGPKVGTAPARAAASETASRAHGIVPDRNLCRETRCELCRNACLVVGASPAAGRRRWPCCAPLWVALRPTSRTPALPHSRSSLRVPSRFLLPFQWARRVRLRRVATKLAESDGAEPSKWCAPWQVHTRTHPCDGAKLQWGGIARRRRVMRVEKPCFPSCLRRPRRCRPTRGAPTLAQRTAHRQRQRGVSQPTEPGTRSCTRGCTRAFCLAPHHRMRHTSTIN